MNPRALIVDDDHLTARMVAEALHAVGFLSAIVPDAPSAMATLQSAGVPELFVLDFVLPGMNGLDLMQRLRSEPLTAEAGFMIITGALDRRSLLAALRMGADDFLLKPFDPSELALRAKAIVDRRAGATSEGLQERRDITVLFADVRGFTPLTERVDPETTVTILNDLFDALDAAVVDHGGHLDKVIGDALMALFGARGAPERHELRACHAALQMQSIAQRFARESLSLGAHAQSFGIGIGVASGQAVLGAVGARRKRQLTAIGDTVNLAARLQGIAERGEVVIDEEVARRLGPPAQLSAGRTVAIKGKEQPRTVYRLLGLPPPSGP